MAACFPRLGARPKQPRGSPPLPAAVPSMADRQASGAPSCACGAPALLGMHDVAPPAASPPPTPPTQRSPGPALPALLQESTIGASFFTKTIPEKHVKFEIWDTAGQERYHSLAPMYYRGAAAAIVVFDITHPASFERAKKWVGRGAGVPGLLQRRSDVSQSGAAQAGGLARCAACGRAPTSHA